MPQNPISRESLRGSSVLIDRVNRDSINLAKMLTKIGARVRLVDPDMISNGLLNDCLELEKEGVRVESNCDLSATKFKYDVWFADLFSSPVKSYIVEARHRARVVSNLADLVFQLSPIPAIGVTGSAGKSTTTTMINEILRNSGLTTYIGQDNFLGNKYPNYELLGQLEHMKQPAWLIAELTSSHLEYMHTSPDIAVVTNLSPDHVEWHGSTEAYYSAKKRILRYQSSEQWAILNHDDLTKSVFAEDCQAQVAYFSLVDEVSQGVFLNDDRIVARWYNEPRTICSVRDVNICSGYLANVLAACAATIAAGVSVQDISRAIGNLRGLAQRREFVGEVAGISIFNDTRASSPKKAIASLS